MWIEVRHCTVVHRRVGLVVWCVVWCVVWRVACRVVCGVTGVWCVVRLGCVVCVVWCVVWYGVLCSVVRNLVFCVV